VRRATLSAVAASAIVSLIQAATILAASPSPDPASGGDPRSSGQGPGLVGDPAFALLAVIVIGLLATAATLIYVRLTPRQDP
jgi:hypothetical protein